MKNTNKAKAAVCAAGKLPLLATAVLLLWACPLASTEEGPPDDGAGLIGMWECVLLGTPPAAAYDFLYINEDLTYTQYFCLTADGVTYVFLTGNASNRGTYTATEDQLDVSVANVEYFEGEWKQTAAETIEAEYAVAGDTLTIRVDANHDGDYEDERETVQYQRRETPLDLNGDGDFLD